MESVLEKSTKKGYFSKGKNGPRAKSYLLVLAEVVGADGVADGLEGGAGVLLDDDRSGVLGWEVGVLVASGGEDNTAVGVGDNSDG